MIQGFLGAAINMIEVVGAIIVIVFLGLYFAAEAGLYCHGLLRLVAPGRRARAAQILGATADTLWRWMLGRLFAMAVLGSLVTLGLWIIGVPLPIALGLLAAIFTFVPYLGAFASAVPSVLIAGAVRLDLALYVVVLYLAIHLVEGYVLIPLVQRRVVRLPPALILSAQIPARRPRRFSRSVAGDANRRGHTCSCAHDLCRGRARRPRQQRPGQLGPIPAAVKGALVRTGLHFNIRHIL